MTGPQVAAEFWARPAGEELRELVSSPEGLSASEAAARLARYGPNKLRATRRQTDLGLLLAQFTSPIILILLAAAVLAIFLGDRPDAIIIVVIVALSGLLTFFQERGANRAVAKLLELVEVHATVVRDGKAVDVPVEQVVPGDVAQLSAGDGIPGDGLVIASHELFVDESTLTGETYPVEKEPGVSPAEAPLAKRTNALWMGTHVVSGSGTMLVVRTGLSTEFGQVSERLGGAQEETEFEHGVRRFGFLLLELTLMLVFAIFAINVFLHKPVLDSFLFSLALAVGLTPQLLPAIISINLAHGARRMADSKVIVKRLASIENFGSMNVLCSDKTGTLTEGVVRVRSVLDVRGNESDEVRFLAFLNASLETGFQDPIDDALRALPGLAIEGWEKRDEEPYDFERKRLSVLAEKDGHRTLVTKGSVAKVLEICTAARLPDGSTAPIGGVAGEVDALYRDLSAQGFRTLGIAVREDVAETRIGRTDERDMTLAGLLVLHDPPKPDAAATVTQLKRLGVTLRVITGDNALVAASVFSQIGLKKPRILTGSELHHLSDLALGRRVEHVDIFAEVEPNQKEDIIRALRAAGNVVGYLGDGINDASGLHAADVGISVNSAVDVAKEAADIVLLEKDLGVLCTGVAEGRTTFANTLKYVFMATSANFGNMFSMAGASLFLPFLPLLPTQILLTNLLTDFPETAIASDTVDQELVEKPRRWDIRFIRNFMLVFGPLSSVFDYLTFGALLLVLHAGPTEFRTGWFVESVLSASVIVLVVRTRRPFLTSRPGKWLTIATAAIGAVTLSIPYVPPLARLFKFTPLPPVFLAMLAVILALYISGAEATKWAFYHWHDPRPAQARRPSAGVSAVRRSRR
ncbi:MAG TPA: magnesium-translocating P-type ATPase [Coriobacteriia bacterium]|jgi:Mg2+-importing ATPase